MVTPGGRYLTTGIVEGDLGAFDHFGQHERGERLSDGADLGNTVSPSTRPPPALIAPCAKHPATEPIDHADDNADPLPLDVDALADDLANLRVRKERSKRLPLPFQPS